MLIFDPTPPPFFGSTCASVRFDQSTPFVGDDIDSIHTGYSATQWTITAYTT
jgi:hypothetical protein